MVRPLRKDPYAKKPRSVVAKLCRYGKMPFKSVTEMGPIRTEQTTDKYEVNIEIDDGKFTPPKK